MSRRRFALREKLTPPWPVKKPRKPVSRWQTQHIVQLWQYDAFPHRWFPGSPRQDSLLELIDFSQPRPARRPVLLHLPAPAPVQL